MKKFKLVLANNYSSRICFPILWNHEINELMKFERKYQAIEVNLRGENAVEDFVKFTEKLGSNVRQLEAYDCTLTERNFKDIFENLPKLEKLILSRVNIKFNTEITETSPVELKSLKSLKLEICQWELLNFIDAELKSLKVLGMTHYPIEPLMRFMLKLRKLESFQLGKSAYEKIFQLSPVKFPFQLKKLKISSSTCAFEYFFPEMPKNFNVFLNEHCKNIENFLCLSPMIPAIYKTIFSSFLSLNSLEIHIFSLPNNLKMYESFKSLRFLKTLKIRGTFESFQLAEAMLGNCSEIETLEVMDDELIIPNLLPFIAVNNFKLKFLSMFNFKSFISEVEFGNLKALELQEVNPENCDALVEFLLRNKKIEVLKLRWTKNVTKGQVEFLASMKPVKLLCSSSNHNK